MQPSYHNTTNAQGSLLNRYQDKALSQDKRLLEYFEQAYRNGGDYILLTPSMALILVFSGSVPITSVRRALSNLTRDGELEKTDKSVKGPYGRLETYWCLVERSPQRRLF